MNKYEYTHTLENKKPRSKKKAHIFLGTCYHILQSIIHQAGYIFEWIKIRMLAAAGYST